MEFAFADIHSHIIPCIDDGSASMENSLEILHAMEQCGTRSLILTPHYCVRRGYTPGREDIEKAFDGLRARSREAGIKIDLYMGCEIEFSSDIPSLLKEGMIPTLADTENILVEFPPYTSAREILNAVHTLIQIGFVPVLAHVERYRSLRNGMDDIRFLKNIGARIQVNVDFISAGRLFTDKFLKELITDKLIDFVAGDIHRMSYTPLQLQKCVRVIERYASADYMRDIFFNNAQKILLNIGEN